MVCNNKMKVQTILKTVASLTAEGWKSSTSPDGTFDSDPVARHEESAL